MRTLGNIEAAGEIEYGTKQVGRFSEETIAKRVRGFQTRGVVFLPPNRHGAGIRYLQRNDIAVAEACIAAYPRRRATATKRCAAEVQSQSASLSISLQILLAATPMDPFFGARWDVANPRPGFDPREPSRDALLRGRCALPHVRGEGGGSRPTAGAQPSSPHLLPATTPRCTRPKNHLR